MSRLRFYRAILSHTEWSLLLYGVIGDWMIPFAANAATKLQRPLQRRLLMFLNGPLESIQSLPLWCMFRARMVPTQLFFNVRCPILCIKTSSMPQCWCGLASDILKKSRLIWKIKISTWQIEKQANLENENKYMADHPGMTQSHARDTRYRRMQKLTSLYVSK